MKPQKQIPIVIALLLLSGCNTTTLNGDPVVIDAQKSIELAKTTTTLVEHVDIDSYAAFKAVNPAAAAAFRTFVNNLRATMPGYLESALTVLDTYKANKTPANKASLQTWIATLGTATAQANKYLSQIQAAKVKGQ